MKKLILILTLIFAFALCFVACEDLADNSNEGQSINAISNGAPYTEEPTTEAPTTEEPTTEEPTSEEATTEEPISEEPTTKGKTFTELSTDDEKGRKLRAELVMLLELKDGCVEPVESILEAQISRNLYWGNRVTHVQFDPSKYYYVCGYYNCSHADENKWYNCAGKYTWLIVNSETDIPEYYNGLKFIAAFQINKTASAIDIATGETVSTEIEHYLEYSPKFVNGKNVAEKRYFDGTYICFTDPEDKYMFDCSEDYFHFTYTLSCIELDGKWYICIKNDDLEVEFGKYYDVLIEIAEEYDNYVILEFNAFAEAVLL